MTSYFVIIRNLITQSCYLSNETMRPGPIRVFANRLGCSVVRSLRIVLWRSVKDGNSNLRKVAELAAPVRIFCLLVEMIKRESGRIQLLTSYVPSQMDEQIYVISGKKVCKDIVGYLSMKT